MQRIRDAAEAAKIELSGAMRTRIHIPFITNGDSGPLEIDIELTRERLEDLTMDLVDRTIANVDRILKEAGSSKAQIDEVLLVGGQSRMPLVQRKVTDFMGRPPSKGVHPDEAVGIGASIMAHSLAGASAAEEVTLLDVLPMPIGINKVDGSMHVLFPKNQPLPDYKTRTLTTSKDNQRSIMLRIYQGEAQLCADNELLGTFVFSGIRPAPRGKVQIEVTFHIDSEGILNLTARDKGTGQTVESTLKLGKAGGVEVIGGASVPTAAKPEDAAPVVPPLPLTMPTSGLASMLSSQEPLAPEPAAPEPSSLSPLDAPLEEVKPEAIEPESLTPEPLPEPAVTPVSAPVAKAPEAKAPDAKAPDAKAPPVAPAAPVAVPAPGGWARFVAWLKGLFGGK